MIFRNVAPRLREAPAVIIWLVSRISTNSLRSPDVQYLGYPKLKCAGRVSLCCIFANWVPMCLFLKFRSLWSWIVGDHQFPIPEPLPHVVSFIAAGDVVQQYLTVKLLEGSITYRLAHWDVDSCSWVSQHLHWHLLHKPNLTFLVSCLGGHGRSKSEVRELNGHVYPSWWPLESPSN